MNEMSDTHTHTEAREDKLASHAATAVPARFGRRVATWFDDRKITENGSVDGQLTKLREEVQELQDSFTWESITTITGRNTVKVIASVNQDEAKDAIGDCAVVLAGIAHMLGMTFEECCEHAWNEIKDRTGHLNEEGVFVKD